MLQLEKETLIGSIPPLVTPFYQDSVDYDVYAKLVEFQIKNGSHGILVTGTTAEPSTLTVSERKKCVDVAVGEQRRKSGGFRQDALHPHTYSGSLRIAHTLWIA